MPVPLPPESLADLQSGPFSFYPAIIGIERNEWVLRRATWTEVQVANTKSGDELWIPRRFLGELARVEAPVMIVGVLQLLGCTLGGANGINFPIRHSYLRTLYPLSERTCTSSAEIGF